MPTELTIGDAAVRLQKRLGAGASSNVWLARSDDGREFALKVGHDEGECRRLALEGERLLALDSSRLNRLLDAGVLSTSVAFGETVLERGLPFLALEVAPGEPLRTFVERAETRALELALCVARDVGLALAELHAFGYSHGDVKPDNVVIRPAADGGFRATLIDLGLSGAALDTEISGGTPRYLNFDVSSGLSPGEARARDVWALGLMLAEIVSRDLRRASTPSALLEALTFPPVLEPIVRAALRAAPEARAGAAWIGRRARLALGRSETEAERIERAKRRVRTAYLAVRRGELWQSAEPRIEVEGVPGEWLSELGRSLSRIRALAGTAGVPSSEMPRLRDLDAFGQSHWLVRLIGPEAAGWQLGPRSDAELAERLLLSCESIEPEGFTLSMIERGAFELGVAPAEDPVAFALALASGAPRGPLLDRIERWVEETPASDALVVALGQSLRLRGELGRALSVLELASSAEARMEAAEAHRRARDFERARALLARGDAASNLAAEARRSATLARIDLAEGRPEQALGRLAGAPQSAVTLEARALAELELAAFAAAQSSLEQARAVATSDEERARIEGVAGTLAHARGDPDAALTHFRRAANHAVRVGAVLEEATYLTGVAAAATNVGELGEALAASRRAILLFEYLARPNEAARAALARSNAYLAAGAFDEGREAARDALVRARAARDARCEAYAELALSELARDRARSEQHAARAAALLPRPSPDERLWIGARLLEAGRRDSLPELDALARTEGVSIEARLAWWAARARAEASSENRPNAAVPLAELSALSQARAPRSVLGAALSAGARLALRVGEGDVARRLLLAASDVKKELLARAPAELARTLAAQDWLSFVDAAREAAIYPEQVAHVERLVRALARRDALQPLFNEVLDALVLWTGVERGLLLLRAPGGKLVPRAARNLLRRDLPAEQLGLSRSLAERALAEHQPVVATDALLELPEFHASVHALKLRSVLAVPLLARGEAFGVVYLDDRVRRGAFGARELAWVRLVASLASVAIADARDQLLLRRAARRAERAEARLGLELADRQTRLEVAERELVAARDTRNTRFSYEGMIGQSEALSAMLRVVDRVTLADVPVLIQGESGSGKELVARAIHKNGQRSGRPFVSENCGAIPESLLESTLFGHVRGAFTGASRPRAGLFEIADGGTLFLDEIAEMSLAMQTKLLRVLEAGELWPVGSERVVRVDVRVMAATHRDLEARVKSGQFREDLFYRLNVVQVRVPPLRERQGDVPLLVAHFAKLHAPDRKPRVTKAALDALSNYAWPGNVRQLENEVRRALVMADSLIELAHLSPEVLDSRAGERARPDGLNVRQRVDALEAELVKLALRRTRGNQTKAAELLGLSRFGLQKMMKRLEIS